MDPSLALPGLYRIFHRFLSPGFFVTGFLCSAAELRIAELERLLGRAAARGNTDRGGTHFIMRPYCDPHTATKPGPNRDADLAA